MELGDGGAFMPLNTRNYELGDLSKFRKTEWLRIRKFWRMLFKFGEAKSIWQI